MSRHETNSPSYSNFGSADSRLICSISLLFNFSLACQGYISFIVNNGDSLTTSVRRRSNQVSCDIPSSNHLFRHRSHCCDPENAYSTLSNEMCWLGRLVLCRCTGEYRTCCVLFLSCVFKPVADRIRYWHFIHLY